MNKYLMMSYLFCSREIMMYRMIHRKATINDHQKKNRQDQCQGQAVTGQSANAPIPQKCKIRQARVHRPMNPPPKELFPEFFVDI